MDILVGKGEFGKEFKKLQNPFLKIKNNTTRQTTGIARVALLYLPAIIAGLHLYIDREARNGLMMVRFERIIFVYCAGLLAWLVEYFCRPL